MAVLKILGSCSGTEPMPDRHHTSLALMVNDRVYFFDAGENCAYAAHLGGVPLRSTRAVFLSHTHFDHMGGLMGLFWNIRKLCLCAGQSTADDEIKLFIPVPGVWDNLHEALTNTEGNFKKHFMITPSAPKLGQFYRDENIRVTAFESHHVRPAEDGTIRSFSYRVDIGSGNFVFSGDIKGLEDLTDAVGDGCDLLLCETGHHSVREVCDFAESHNVKKLVFIHHGREILENRPTVAEALNACKIDTELAFDGMELSV